MNEKIQSLKDRFSLTEEQKKAVAKEAKKFAYTVAFGIAASVAINAGTKMVENQIDEWKNSSVEIETPVDVEIDA